MRSDLKAINAIAQAFMGMTNKQARKALAGCSVGDCDATLEHVERLVKQGHDELTHLERLLKERIRQIKFIGKGS